MRVYTKRLIISFLAIFLGVTVTACSDTTDTTVTTTPNDSVIPAISEPDKVFISGDDYSITYGDLFQQVKINDGLTQLLTMVDTALISSYLTAVTDQEIAERTKKLIYDTTDQTEIDAMSDTDKADKEQKFYDSMYLLGYDESNMDDYVRFLVAKENYAKEQIVDPSNSEETWYAGPTAVANRYDKKYDQDINMIKIHFFSQADAKNVMQLFNLVSKNGELKLYTGDTPLNQVPTTALNDTNTRSLSDQEILQMFIKMYNYVYGGYRTPISETATYDDLINNSDLVVTRQTLKDANSSLDDLVYDTLGTYENYTNGTDDTMYYTYSPVSYPGSKDTSYYMLLNLSKPEKADVTDFDGNESDLVALIGQDLYDQLKQEIIDDDMSSPTFTQARMVSLRAEHNFVIYDYYLAKDYQTVASDFETDPDGSATNIASYDDTYITADQFLTFSLNRNAPLYTVYAVQTPYVIAQHFEDVYCTDDTVACEYDVNKNTSDEMATHFDSYDSLQEQFNNSYYASYYTFEEYLYLAYGVKTKEDMIYQYYVKGTLQPFVIYDQITSNDYDILHRLMDMMQPYYDNYFDLDINHLLIYVDRDENGKPDDYQDFYDSLDDQAAFDQMLADFQTDIEAYLNQDGNTMTSLVSAYNNAKRDDATWGEYKAFGLYLMTEKLGDKTYSDSINTYEDSFTDALVTLYQDYQLPENINKDYIYSQNLTETSYGVHLIKVAKGDKFDKPTAKFAMTYDSETGDPKYDAGMVNTGDELTFDQLKIYADYRFYEIAQNSADLEAIYGFEKPAIPNSVLAAINAYFSDLYDGLYVVGYLNDIVISNMLAGNYDHEQSSYCNMTEAVFNEKIQHIYDIYDHQIFADLDVR